MAPPIGLIAAVAQQRQRFVISATGADFEAMNRAIARHRLRPVVDRVFPFDEAPDAYRYFESRAHLGKVVIKHG
jgi:NADPH:quinone reductase-like Zn-dependent oxidoreductase